MKTIIYEARSLGLGRDEIYQLSHREIGEIRPATSREDGPGGTLGTGQVMVPTEVPDFCWYSCGPRKQL